MKITKRTAITGAIVLAALAALSPLLIRLWTGWRRHVAVNTLLNSGRTARERVNVVPVEKTFAAPGDGKAVDIGFAKFELGKEDAPSSIRLIDSAGIIYIALKSGDFYISFMNPSAPAERDAAELPGDFPQTAAYIREVGSDEIAARIAMEQTRPASFAALCAMSKDEYLLYYTKLQLKVGLGFGGGGVFWFRNAETKGIAEVGGSPGDRASGLMSLISADGGKVVECYVKPAKGKTGDGARLIEQIAATFVFTVDNIADKDEIRRKIAAAGIK
ncbi:MAG TPA: hypothetical protein VG733_09700 [Chthoniobacteraceae bacterium]|nr:hypothetical protein [Chthoniobacteraceae bacterium]